MKQSCRHLLNCDKSCVLHADTVLGVTDAEINLLLSTRSAIVLPWVIVSYKSKCWLVLWLNFLSLQSASFDWILKYAIQTYEFDCITRAMGIHFNLLSIACFSLPKNLDCVTQPLKLLELRTVIYWDSSGSEGPSSCEWIKALKYFELLAFTLAWNFSIYCGISLSPTRTLSWLHDQWVILQMILVLVVPHQTLVIRNLIVLRIDFMEKKF